MNLFIIASIYSLVLLGISLVLIVITLFKIIPEVRIHDRLLPLRRLLLADGIFTFLLLLVAFTIIGARYFLSLDSYRYLSYVLLILFTTVILSKTVVKYLIYTLHYDDDEPLTSEQKKE